MYSSKETCARVFKVAVIPKTLLFITLLQVNFLYEEEIFHTTKWTSPHQSTSVDNDLFWYLSITEFLNYNNYSTFKSICIHVVCESKRNQGDSVIRWCFYKCSSKHWTFLYGHLHITETALCSFGVPILKRFYMKVKLNPPLRLATPLI